MKTSRYLDPATSGYIVRRGKHVRVARAIGWVYNMLRLHRGTVPGAEDLGSRIHEIEHTGPTVAQEIQAAANEALRLGLSTVFKAFRVDVWLQQGQPVMEVTVWVAGYAKPIVIPYLPWQSVLAT